MSLMVVTLTNMLATLDAQLEFDLQQLTQAFRSVTGRPSQVIVNVRGVPRLETRFKFVTEFVN